MLKVLKQKVEDLLNGAVFHTANIGAYTTFQAAAWFCGETALLQASVTAH